MAGKAVIVRMLVRRCADFAPPGEELLSLFEAIHRQKSFVRPFGTPIYVLLTTHHVTFVRRAWLNEEPIQTVATFPLSAIRFSLPVPLPGGKVIVFAHVQDADGQAHEWRLDSATSWWNEVVDVVRAVNAIPGGPPYASSGQSHPAQSSPSQSRSAQSRSAPSPQPSDAEPRDAVADAPPEDEPADAPPEDARP
jgi:hypothetical protein